MKSDLFHVSLLCLALFILPTTTFAQTSCGSIIDDSGEATAIIDCDNPLNITGSDYPHPFTVEGESVTNGSIINVSAGGTRNYETVDARRFFGIKHELYRHEGANYLFLGTLPDKFFGPFDPDTDEVVAMPLLTAGTYTLVTEESMGFQTRAPSLPERLFSFFVPTAYAQFSSSNLRRSLTFTIVETPPEPTGASSILFLPGIMGSDLYEESDVCLGSGEQKRWSSTSDCDQRRLFTNSAGNSINDIYTKNGDSSIVDEMLGLNLYKSFMKEMNDLEDQDLIADFTPFPYDWRLRLDDLLKTTKDPATGIIRFDSSTTLEEGHLYKTVEEMVKNSLSGKVSIVAHSNGGLLAKVFLNALRETNDPLLDNIDNLILVGSPQAGTPDAVVSMLNGSPILHGLVVGGSTSRDLLNTAPFGHHLLPSQLYFASDDGSVDTPVITIESGEETDAWLAQFGAEIKNSTSLHAFLDADSGRTKPAGDDLLHPEVVDGTLLEYATQIADFQSQWQPTGSTKVYQIAGTGVETVSGLTYFTDYECVRSNFLIFGCAEYQPKLGYRVNHTYDGDETVVVPSALAMEEGDGVERWWVDLGVYNEANFDVVHKNILELDEIQSFIKDVIASSSHSPYEYLSDTPVIPNEGERLEFQLHSPLDMSLVSEDGVVSSTTVSIPGAIYRRYGEIQYISLPKTANAPKLQLQGYKAGSFSLEITKREGNGSKKITSYTAVPNITSTIVSIPLEDFTASTTLLIDFDGDGEVDGEVTAEAESPAEIEVKTEDVVVQEEVEVSSGGGSSSGSGIKKRRPAGEVAGVTTSLTAEEQYLWEMIRLLEELKRLLILLNNIN